MRADEEGRVSEPNETELEVNVTSRREVIRTTAVAIGGMALGAAAVRAAASDEEISHNAESIHQEVVSEGNRKRVYEGLTETKEFDKVVRLSTAMQGGMPPGARPTEISAHVGGAFALFAGHIVGRHHELVPGERIVQAWRVVDWKPGAYSIAKFELVEHGAGTKIVFDHTGFPTGLAEHLAEG